MSSLTRWQPLKDLPVLRQQMNRVFAGLLHSEPIASILPQMEWLPATSNSACAGKCSLSCTG